MICHRCLLALPSGFPRPDVLGALELLESNDAVRRIRRPLYRVRTVEFSLRSVRLASQVPMFGHVWSSSESHWPSERSNFPK